MKMLIFFTFFLTINFVPNVHCQIRKNKGDYVDKSSKLTLPQTFDEFERTDILILDKKNLNLRASYQNQGTINKFKFTILIYPAGNATEDRLREEFIKSTKNIPTSLYGNNQSLNSLVFFENNGVKLNGLRSYTQNETYRLSILIFECGRWFFKVNINSNVLDSIDYVRLEERILEHFKPTRMVEAAPLKLKANIRFSDAAFADSMMLGSAMGSAYKKLEWALDNVDSLESISGFPGLYLELHVESIKEFVNFENTHPNFSKNKETANYLAELNAIIEQGFLEEFIMEQYQMLLIVPKNYQLDFDAYDQWKKSNPIKIDLMKRFYRIELIQ